MWRVSSIEKTRPLPVLRREMASHSGEVSDNGILLINEAIAGMKRIAQTIGHSSEVASPPGNESQQIPHIVNCIREIVDQTNLPALNAAIEAVCTGLDRLRT